MQKLLISLLSLLLLFSCEEKKEPNEKTKTEEITETTEEQKGNEDFLAFAEEFPVLKELSISGEMMDKLQLTDYQLIAPEDIIKYLYQMDPDATNQSISGEAYKGLPCKSVEKPTTKNIDCHLPKAMLEQQDSISFYYYGQIKVSDQIKSLIFFYKDQREELMPKGIFFLLFNYDLNGKFISKLDLASAEKFMSYRIHEAYWADNFIQQSELDYEANGPADNPYILTNGTRYISSKNIQINEDGSLTDLGKPELPYANKVFKNEQGDKTIKFGSNDPFSIQIEPMGTNMLTILDWDFAEGNFLVRIGDENYELNFNGTFDNFEWKNGQQTEYFNLVQ